MTPNQKQLPNSRCLFGGDSLQGTLAQSSSSSWSCGSAHLQRLQALFCVRRACPLEAQLRCCLDRCQTNTQAGTSLSTNDTLQPRGRRSKKEDAGKAARLVGKLLGALANLVLRNSHQRLRTVAAATGRKLRPVTADWQL